VKLDALVVDTGLGSKVGVVQVLTVDPSFVDVMQEVCVF